MRGPAGVWYNPRMFDTHEKGVKMRVLRVGAALLAAYAAAADVLDDNRVTYGNDNAGYRRLHVGYPGAGGTRVDAAGYEQMRAVYLQELAARTAARPTDAALALEYGEALMFKGDFVAAEPILVRALAQAKVPAPVLAGLLYRAAECRLVAGDKAACRAQLERLVALKGVTHWRKREWAKWARDALVVLQGDDAAMDAQGLPQTRTARAYPEPQQARYGEKMVPLAPVRLTCRGIAEGDARIRLLKRRLGRLGLGVSTRTGAYALEIACTNVARVAQREGYALSVDATGARIEARDAQGVLWGVVSLLQLVDYEAKTIRPAEIVDWPDTAARGYIGEYWAGCAEYTVFQKMNSVVLRILPTQEECASPLNLLQLETTCRQFGELGLTLYCDIGDVTREPPHLPFCWPETMDYIVALSKRYAALGASVYFPHDDLRYPLPPPDLEAYGTGSAIDADFVTRVYRAVKQDYPAFKMVYCPPYYYGPYSAPKYPDDRDTYLKSLAEKLDPAIGVYWTGPHVKSRDKSPDQVAWFAGITGRKPFIFQNATGPHNLLSYIVDETDWNDWHYPGFFVNDIAAFHKNAHTPRECPQTATLADCLWNIAGYDKARSIRRGVAQLLGDGLFDVLNSALPALAYFDKYRRGALTAEIFHENPDDLDRKVAASEAAWRRAMEINPVVAQYGMWPVGLKWAKGVARAARNPPDLLSRYRAQTAACRALAEAEVGVDSSRGDLFYALTDFRGGGLFNTSTNGAFHCTESRFTCCLRGAQTDFAVCTFPFECDPFPPAGAYELFLCGLDDELPSKTELRLAVNGTVFFEGDPGFVNSRSFKVARFTVPFAALKRYNEIKIEVVSKGYNPFGAPWVMINYAVLKKAAQ